MPRQSIKTDTEGRLRRLGLAIRAVRSERGLSQEALADAAGIDRSHMGKIERGERNVSLLNVARIADALSTSIASLMIVAEI
ncbi:helix-turn-helix domain-containing protein [Novosphingobium album (ex Liu et al. 2023)]|uniref:Helix-turn-helix transcriptional regulator n=1 Tax=Novosphingobium album (ex Liu et al. 2023) TaxID=3031130 RepID=A0ABT5WN09_9SPHN|nr:helix-turn-helix transcriptional regulator [Novosphingobium album (ex Liu et al. 2023)]MDE8651430.1 helix-turn-helix transcriptional regulator [Novosphingobium album (ex Liu et al. 2023)]